jgi:hypothetical protein
VRNAGFTDGYDRQYGYGHVRDGHGKDGELSWYFASATIEIAIVMRSFVVYASFGFSQNVRVQSHERESFARYVAGRLTS